MGERKRQSFAHAEEKLDTETKEEDRISQLPDDILIDIISHLNSVTEAARTSSLSTRWKYLWTFSTVLNFGAPDKLWKLPKFRDNNELTRIMEERRSKYISWVNKVLQLHSGLTISEFMINFELYDSHKSIITDWIYTVIAKGVQKLELNLNQCLEGWGNKYTFPQDCNNILKSGIKSLNSLSLVNVNITRESLEFFICSCPLLERLQIKSAENLSGFKIVGSSIQLKHLHIHCCFSIKEIEISAPSLLSFKYHGDQIKLHVENVPLLLDVSMGGIYGVPLRNLIDPIKKYLTQLETLELTLYLDNTQLPFPMCVLPKLRYLSFVVYGHDSKSLFELPGMIKACPFLQKFTLKLIKIGHNRRRKIHEFPKCLHHHLKVVEIIGFVGCPFDLEFAFYILKNAVMLEKMIINPTNPYSLGQYWEFEDDREKQVARRRAKLLEEKVPQGVELVIL